VKLVRLALALTSLAPSSSAPATEEKNPLRGGDFGRHVSGPKILSSSLQVRVVFLEDWGYY